MFQRSKPIKTMLPTGVMEFNLWADNIIAQSGLLATPESQKFVLANLILELPKDVDAEKDSFFITRLRKSAANQVADSIRTSIRDAAKARLTQPAETTAPAGTGEVLEKREVSETRV